MSTAYVESSVIEENLLQVAELLDLLETIPFRMDSLRDARGEGGYTPATYQGSLLTQAVLLLEELSQLENIDEIRAILSQLRLKLYQYCSYTGSVSEPESYGLKARAWL